MVGTWWFWVSMWRYLVVLDQYGAVGVGIGSEFGGCGWYLVVPGHHWAVMVVTWWGGNRTVGALMVGSWWCPVSMVRYWLVLVVLA